MAITPILLSPNEFKITTNNDEGLVTTGLEACVGVALIHKAKSTLTRGLSHIFYCGSGQEDFPKAQKLLDKFLRQFPPNPMAVAAAVPFTHLGQKNQNPMLDYVESFLREHNISLTYTDNQGVVKLNTLPISEREIATKTMVVTPTRVKVIYYDRGGVFLNPPNGNLYDF
jgi:hypothetical protein